MLKIRFWFGAGYAFQSDTFHNKRNNLIFTLKFDKQETGIVEVSHVKERLTV